MLSEGKESTAILLTVVLLASGIAGATLGGTSAETAPVEPNPVEPNPVEPNPVETNPAASAQDGQESAETECAATPPEDGADPGSDVKGWENGIWYDESIDVNQDDGVQEDERERIVSRTMARVEAVRCIEFDQSVPVSVISRQEFREQQLNRNTSEGLRKFDNVKFEALLLIGEDEDSIEVQNENRGVGVLGYYSPQQDEIVVVAESAEDLRIDELTLAHELVHAWQDEQFNLSGAELDSDFRDEVNAISGLVEGDASYTDTLYEENCGVEWECLDAPERDGGGDQLANIGVYLLKFQPYSDGPAFVRMVRDVGGWSAVDAMYENPPASTEQVIHPLRYRSDPPTNVTFDDTATDDWERVRAPDRAGYGRLGEAAVMMMFVYPYYDSQGQTELVPPEEWFNYNRSGNLSDVDPLNYESDYSTGWDGDRLHVYENDAGEFGYVWKLAWDSPQNAQQFVDGYQQVLEYWGGEQVEENVWRIERGGFADAFYVDIDGRNVTIVNAPTVGQLSEVRSGVEVAATGQATETTTGEATTEETATTETTGLAATATVEVEANETTTTA
ncbi:Hvo_1808 family surface protein [Halorussus salinisoli]|uniref:Hvo_1808 family surface protein n=1 Tax=Halorussus salinisoli TaxID=2558242 RepID=UPI001484F8F2|nr:Hvo_1808 family surface protein [Halorussus salinisoli]